MNKTFVLIHGTWHGGWAWQDVIVSLEAKGHRAYAPTLAGHGPGATRSGISHESCVDSVVSYILRHDLKDVVLVGHSFGGTVVQKATERIADRIARAVFLDALIVEHHNCVFDVLPTTFVESLAPENGIADAAGVSSDPPCWLRHLGKSGATISYRMHQNPWHDRRGKNYLPSPTR